MPKLPYKQENFTPSRADGELDVSALRLLWAAATVGVATTPVSGTMRRPLIELMWRCSMVMANLEVTKSGYFTRSDSYDRLDPSEKSAVSYFLGMVQARLTSRFVLGYSHLLHVDPLLIRAGQPLAGSRPDFVAAKALGAAGIPTSGATLEAKGRTNGFDARAATRAKAQAGTVPALPHFTRTMAIASVAYFAADTDRWTAHLEDPPAAASKLDVTAESYFRAYYEPLIQAGRDAGNASVEGEAWGYDLPGMGLRVNIAAVIVEAFEADPNATGQQSFGELLAELAEAGADGDHVEITLSNNSEVQEEALLLSVRAEE